MHLSRSRKGKLKIVYTSNSTRRIMLFEPIGNNILETTFEHDGSIVNQKLLRMSKSNLENIVGSFIEEIGASEVVQEDYKEVKLERKCPKCGKGPLTRYMDTLLYPREAPVMPFYVCDSCGARSYYLTDTYLKNLIITNREMFSPNEVSQMAKNERIFLDDLRAHIIRIFASKKIMYIK